MKLYLILIILFIIAVVYYDGTEGFTDRTERAQKIVDWFKANKHGSYQQFRRDLQRTSNIVEYNDARDLARNGALTREALLARI